MKIKDYLSLDRKIRNQIIKKLKIWLKPKLRDSGFTTGPIGNSKVLQLCVFPRDMSNGNLTLRGFVENGIIEDAANGGLVYGDFESLNTRQLISVLYLSKQVDKGKFNLI